MAKLMKRTAIISVVATIVFAYIYSKTDLDWLFSASITFGTIAFHLVIRLLIGAIVDCIMHNHADYDNKWFQLHPFEERLYKKLKVKTWKDKLPTYDVDSFSVQKKTFDEIAQATCQSEIVHEINIVVSFLPLFAAYLFGSFMVFLITSILAAGFDLIFVIIQRYNRPRLVKLAKKMR